MSFQAHTIILADDLSGAADCAAPFARVGQEVRVAFDAEFSGHAQVVAIELDTRRMTEAEARDTAARAARRVADADGAIVYKKIDSTLRGHVAAELGVTIHELTPRPLTLFAPAFPSMGRTTSNGRVLVNGTPLEETETWRHSGIGGSADLVKFLKPSGLRVERVALEEIRGDLATLAMSVRMRWEAGVDVLVCDATEEADLRALARISPRLKDVRILFVGSAGLASHLAATLTPVRGRPPLRVQRNGPVVFLVGSVSTVSRTQLETLTKLSGIEPLMIAPLTLLGGDDQPAWRALRDEMERRLTAGADAAVSTTSDSNVDPGTGGPLALALGRLIKEFRDRIGALVITGGETARAVLTAMNVHALDLRGEVEPGVPLGVACGEHQIPIATKAGAFGNPETFLRCREILHQVLGR